MRVKVIRSFAAYRRGFEFDPPDGQANELIRRGLVVPLNDDKKPKPKNWKR